MFYEKDGLKKDLIAKMKQALINYENNVDTTNAGYNILRWAGQGLLVVKKDCEAEAGDMVMNWYPDKMAYVVLRMAKKGMIEVKE